MIRALIVEDSPPAMVKLQNRLKKYCPEVEVVGKAYAIDDGVKQALELKPQLVFLDIEFPVKSGFDFLEETSGLDYQVIFTTGSNEYAVRAFEYSALHYILKMEKPKKLIEAVARARKSLEEKSERSNTQSKTLNYNLNNPKNPRVAFPKDRGFETRDVNKILWCEAAPARKVSLHAEAYPSLNLNQTLTYIESRLKDFPQFYRVSQSHLINIHHMAAYKYDGQASYVKMDDGKKLAVSTRQRQGFEDFLREMGILPTKD